MMDKEAELIRKIEELIGTDMPEPEKRDWILKLARELGTLAQDIKAGRTDRIVWDKLQGG